MAMGSMMRPVQEQMRLAHCRVECGPRVVLLRFLADEDGQNVLEYGIIVATITIVVLLGTTAFGNQVQPWFRLLAGRITTLGT